MASASARTLTIDAAPGLLHSSLHPLQGFLQRVSALSEAFMLQRQHLRSASPSPMVCWRDVQHLSAACPAVLLHSIAFASFGRVMLPVLQGFLLNHNPQSLAWLLTQPDSISALPSSTRSRLQQHDGGHSDTSSGTPIGEVSCRLSRHRSPTHARHGELVKRLGPAHSGQLRAAPASMPCCPVGE